MLPWRVENALKEGDAVRIIQAMDAEFMGNFAAKNAERLARDFYAEDAQLLLPHQGPAVGRPAIQGMFEAMMGDRLRHLVLRTTKIEVSEDLAYGIGLYTMSATLGSGADIINSNLPAPLG